MKLSFLIPFRDADGTRTPAKDWIAARWQAFYPEAEFVFASDDGVDPFCKSMAVNAAARQATGDVFAILDADTWVDPRWVNRGLELMQQGATWVIPARTSLRLRREVSDRLMALEPAADLPALYQRDAEQYGPVCGFLWLIPRNVFEAVGGMDERFRGWGGEDQSFIWAVDRVVGRHYKLPGVVVSLWHARPRDARHKRIWAGQETNAEPVKDALYDRYRRALARPAMLRVLSEEQGPLFGQVEEAA